MTKYANLVSKTFAFFTNTIVGVHICRALAYTVATAAFMALVYGGLVLGMDIPTWRMNGESDRIYAQVAQCVVLFVLTLGAFIGSHEANNKLMVLSAKNDQDEI